METEPPGIDTSIAHQARMYDYWLGGKDNYAPDRELGDAIRRHVPTISDMARANRAFMERVVRYLAGEVGISRFLDIGTGIPTTPNVHQTAQAIVPSARVLYVDYDPLVLAHARALMSGTPEGRTEFVLADFREPESILDSPALSDVLDGGQPIALLMIAMLMYFDGDSGPDPYPIVRRLVDGLPSGSHVAISHPTGDFDPEAMHGVHLAAREAGMTILPRSRDQVAAFADGLEILDPGVVPVSAWQPGTPGDDPDPAWLWGFVARKP